MGIERDPAYVLLAESGKNPEDSLSGQIGDAGWKYDRVSDGESLIAAASQNDYDVIITDWVLPGINKEHLLASLCNGTSASPVLVLNSNKSMEKVCQALKLGAAGYFQRPLDFHSLKKAVELTLKEKDAVGRVAPQFAFYSFTSTEIAASHFPLAVIDNLEERDLITAEERRQVDLAFQEALSNSLEHGNLVLDSTWKDEFDENGVDKYSLMKKLRLVDSHYADRKVFVSTIYCQNKLEIVLKDQGHGFDVGEYMPHDSCGEPIFCHGRGLILIAENMDVVVFSEKGSRLAMTKILST